MLVDHLIEIIFRNISNDKIGDLLKDLNSNGQKIVNYNFTCDCPEIDWSIETSIEKVFLEKNNPTARSGDRAAAENIIKNLHNALEE